MKEVVNTAYTIDVFYLWLVANLSSGIFIPELFLREPVSRAKVKFSQYICNVTDKQLAELAVKLHIYVMKASFHLANGTMEESICRFRRTYKSLLIVVQNRFRFHLPRWRTSKNFSKGQK